MNQVLVVLDLAPLLDDQLVIGCLLSFEDLEGAHHRIKELKKMLEEVEEEGAEKKRRFFPFSSFLSSFF